VPLSLSLLSLYLDSRLTSSTSNASKKVFLSTAPPTRIQPKRKARFTGKYGKGIDFFKINNHTTNLASYTGDTTLYNLSNQIREKLERLRRYAAIHS
jgi:hypothetical protein